MIVPGSQPRKSRAFSANKAQTRNYNSKRNYSRCRKMKNLTQISESDPNNTKIISKIGNDKDNNNLSKLLPIKNQKDPDQIYEENLHLKKAVNQLNNHIKLQRGKIQVHKKKNYQYTQHFDRQFNKEMYWTNNNTAKSHIITGIKHQYEKMKQFYNQKCEENIELKKKINFTQFEQLRIFCDTLIIENRQLKDQLQLYAKIQSALPYRNIYHEEFRGQNNQDSNTVAIIMELKFRNKKMQNQIAKIKQTQTQLSILVEQKEKKIQFLERMIIQKDNNMRNAIKKVKKIEKERDQIIKNTKKLQKKFDDEKNKYENQMKRIQQLQNNKSKIQLQMFQKYQDEKNNKIVKLQKQIAYLSTLLEYWKPLDQLQNHIDMEKKGQVQELNRSNHHYQVNSSKKIVTHIENANWDDLRKTKNAIEAGLEIDDNSKELQQKYDTRKVKNAGIKNSKQSTKQRKVNLREVEDLSQTLKYRLIGYQISSDQAKIYFDYQGQSQNEPFWEKDYITMGQISQTMQKHPFLLKYQQAHLLSRYIIQDSPNQHVYCDVTNQISRAIAKSILKAFVQEYQIPCKDHAGEEWRIIKSKYSHNMQLALASLASKGVISHHKFLQLMISLGIEVSQKTQQWCIGKMMIGSQQLSRLKYSLMFEPEQRLQ